MMSCKKATEAISRQQDEPLSFKQKLDLKLHLMMCKACRAFSKNLSSLSDVMKAFRDPSSKDTEGSGGPEQKR